jgi:predicted Zn-dependent peptidase
MSSRLFQTVREERGLAYSIYSDVNPYRDAGMLCVFAGTSGEKAPQVIHLVLEEFRRFKEEPIPADELERAKDQLKGNVLLGLESSSARMSNLARQEMYFQQYLPIEELIERVNAVTPESVQAMARQLFQQDRLAVALLGRLNGIKVERKDLAC